jgi:hypothetical protein
LLFASGRSQPVGGQNDPFCFRSNRRFFFYSQGVTSWADLVRDMLRFAWDTFAAIAFLLGRRGVTAKFDTIVASRYK